MPRGSGRQVPELYDLSPALDLIPWAAPALMGAAAITIMRRRAERGRYLSRMAHWTT